MGVKFGHTVYLGQGNFKTITKGNIVETYINQATTTEKAQVNYEKSILGVPRNSDHLAIYGELGIYPFYIKAIKSLLRYWNFEKYKSNNNLHKEAYACNKAALHKDQSNWLEFAVEIQNLVPR